MFKRKKVGLALGSGSAKGLAHIGVLKVLEKYKIPIDYIAGTSMGAVIGSVYCYKPDAEFVEQTMLEAKAKWNKLIDLTFPKTGLIKGEKIEKEIRSNLKRAKFKDLKIPFYVTAVDLESEQEVVFHKGDVAKAVRASLSIPGVFVPVENNGRTLVDGGVMDPLPVEILKKAGADVIIAVNVLGLKDRREYVEEEAIAKESKAKKPNIIHTLLRTFHTIETEGSRAILEKLGADLIIAPDLEGVNSIDFAKVREMSRLGEKAAERALKDIKRLAKPNFFQRFFR